MKNITEGATFAEDPFSLVKKAVLCGIAGFIMLAAALSIFRLPPDNQGNENTSERFILIILGVEVLIFLMLFLIRSFTRKRTVICDSKGCDIYTTDFWNTSYESENLLWSEATDTNIIEEYIDKSAKTIFIVVEVKNRPKRLMSQYLSSRRTFSELVEFINQATPHLNYVWKKNSDTGDRRVIVETRNFSKVARGA